MRRSLVLALTALGGTASAAEIGRNPAHIDPATWRWHVSSILVDQSRKTCAVTVQGASARNFPQLYLRYSTIGRLEHRP